MPTITAAISRVVEDVPPESIYRAATRPSAMPKWIGGISELQAGRASDDPVREGDMIEAWEFDGDGPFRGAVTLAEAPTSLKIEFPSYALRSLTIELSSHGHGTHMTLWSTAQPGQGDLLAHIMFRLARSRMHREMEKDARRNLDRLVVLAGDEESAS